MEANVSRIICYGVSIVAMLAIIAFWLFLWLHGIDPTRIFIIGVGAGCAFIGIPQFLIRD